MRAAASDFHAMKREVAKKERERELLNDLITVSAGRNPAAISGRWIREKHEAGNMQSGPVQAFHHSIISSSDVSYKIPLRKAKRSPMSH